MSTAELFDQLNKMSDQERLELIETATRLVRENLTNGSSIAQDQRIRDAASGVRDLYNPGRELTEWTALDGEELAFDYI
jgi:hypothetical protein